MVSISRLALGAGSVVVLGLLLTGCVPSDSEIEGRWESDDGGVLVFSADKTFTTENIPVEVFCCDAFDGIAEAGERIDGQSGVWYVETPMENPYTGGHAIKISWETDPMDWIADALLVDGRGDEMTISITLGSGGDTSDLYTFHRAED